MLTRFEQVRAIRLRWGRTALGWALILHSFGHAAAAISAISPIGDHGSFATAGADRARIWIVSILFAFAMTTLLAGGIGSLSGKPFAARWRALATAGLFTSIVLLGWTLPAGTVLGITINVGLLIAVVKAEGSKERAERNSPRRMNAHSR